jgi:transposase, IS30 family
VCREIARNGGWEKYRAHRAQAQARAEEERCRPEARKMDVDPVLRRRVVSGLRGGFSPDQVAGRLRYDRSCGQAGQVVSHEAIYAWMHALPKGELARIGVELRSGRQQRKPRGRKRTPGARIAGMRPIEDRPAEVAGRQVPGHWEGDLVVGKNGATAAGTLVERTSRFTALVPLPFGRAADQVRTALIESVADLPAQLVKSLTWDQPWPFPGVRLLSGVPEWKSAPELGR